MKTSLGAIEIRKEHPFSEKCNGYHITPYLQEMIVYAGQLDCYEGGEKVLKKLADVEIGSTQMFRITNTYGAQLLKEQEPERTLPPVKKEDVVYVQTDGSMILTRDKASKSKDENDKLSENQWREVKLCRIFKSSDCLHPEGKPGMIRQSQYFASLGTLRAFIEPLTEIIDSYGCLNERLVFISDGATWIRNWNSDAYPNATCILDYFHASEHLGAFAGNVFKDEKQKWQWCEQQEALLKESQVEEVIKEIETIGKEGYEKEAEALIQYYRNNIDRMDYKRYRQTGCGIIGSGAIESAHRTVIQKRMKLSGQRWSIKVAKVILILRTTECNQQWSKVIDLVKREFVAVA